MKFLLAVVLILAVSLQCTSSKTLVNKSQADDSSSVRPRSTTPIPTCAHGDQAQACVYSQGGQDFVAICAKPKGCGPEGYRCCKDCCLLNTPGGAGVPYCRHLTPNDLCRSQ